jgi:hypothetical protein
MRRELLPEIETLERVLRDYAALNPSRTFQEVVDAVRRRPHNPHYATAVRYNQLVAELQRSPMEFD